MNCIVFDSGAIISLAMNDLLWTLKVLKEKYDGEFYIPLAVKKEIVDKPLKSKRFKLEAIMVNNLIREGVLKVQNVSDIKEIMFLANNLYQADGKNITILQQGEIEALVLAMKLNASAYVVDERTMRMFIEDMDGLKDLLERKLNTRVSFDKNKFGQLKKMISGINVIRSSELMLVAYEKGLFKDYVKTVGKREFVDGLLWGLRLRGVAISTDEINKLVKYES